MKRKAFAVTALAVLTAGCDLGSGGLPLPGTTTSGPSYHLRVEFADVLNLPQGATVISNGVRIGRLTGMTVVDQAPGADRAHSGYVVADVAIRSSVHLPVGTTAALRQETPLGDVHIALTPPVGATAPDLPPDATIPLADTSKSPPIEDVLAGLSTFVGSGAITDMQHIVRDVNGVLPADPRDTAHLSGLVGSDLTDLGDHLDSVDHLLDGLQATVDDGLRANTSFLDELLTPYGVQHTTDVVNAEIGVVFVLTALGPVAPATRWLAPLVQSLDDATRAVVPMLFGSSVFDTGSPSNLNKLVDLLQHRIIPFAQAPKVNLRGITVDPPAGTSAVSAEEQTGRIVDTLRMIGAVR
ncbi:MlaD family protein [Nocardia stercoris]|uniref:MCE family protein n=1 Tax=Nocardia stercoris TaxID=2483361 RepID=A0A3M2KXR0_9NOCA|nr:MlaD family protein [Nocardia stercoris]RMI30041.1 MCE family protein [Nocardia stercoris]